MVILSKKTKKIGEIKQNTKNFHLCPFCGKKIEIGIEYDLLKKISEDKKFPYPHIHLHGTPLHGMLCYIDKNLNVRGIGVIKSIEISRDYNTFKQFMLKWSNPY